jgi:hypothetical protein
VLPAWATVVIALGGSAIVAAFSLFGTLIATRHQRQAEWHQRLVDASDDFSTGVWQAVRAVREAVQAFNEGDLIFGEYGEWLSEHPTLVAAAERGAAVADDRLARVLLLFGQDSPAGTAAERAVEALRAAAEGLSGYLRGVADDEKGEALPGYGKGLRAAEAEQAIVEKAHAEFNRHARSALPGKPRRLLFWRR